MTDDVVVGKTQEVEGPDRSWRAGAFDGQFPLDLTAHTTEPSVVGAFVRAALANYRESKQDGNEWKHSILTQR
jgi:hypothetical protein